VSFCRAFQIDSEDILGRGLFELDSGGWDIPALRTLLERNLAQNWAPDSPEIEKDFARIGRRILRLHASKVNSGPAAKPILFLNLEDVTDKRAIEGEKERLQAQTNELLKHKETLLQEMEHRIVNSLQIIASILMLKARAVSSEETRQHLEDAHRRVISIAAVQRHLHSSGRVDLIDVGPYLSKLCESLSESMIGESRPASLRISADDGQVLSADAVSLGLIVTELVINALKYAFPRQPDAAIVTIRYEVSGAAWKLSVADNGVGNGDVSAKGGLGTSLVKALAHQLDAQVETKSTSEGMTVTVTHAIFTSRFPQAA
jgi:chemotaxis protein methyltransferase CheR